jgi:hypothetical protein
MKPWILLTLAAGWLSVRAYASTDPLPPCYAVGLKGGTTGLGLELARSFPNPRWQLRLGGSHLGYGAIQTVALNKKSPLRLDPDVRLALLRAGVDFYPFRRSNLHLSAGLAYQLRPEYAAWIDAPTGIDYEGIVIAGDEFGSIDLRLRWARVLPYLGLGLGRAVPKGRFGGGFDLGGYYLGPPRLRTTMTGLIESTTLSDEVPRIEKNMRGYRYLPNLTLHFRYRLTR